MDFRIAQPVHFVDETGAHRAAIVTSYTEGENGKGVADLAVFPGQGVRSVFSIPHDEQWKKRGTFHAADSHDSSLEENKPSPKPGVTKTPNKL